MADSAPVEVGTAHVVCPVCEAVMPAVVTAQIVSGDAAGRVMLECTPDMSDVWAHMWTHDEGDARG